MNPKDAQTLARHITITLTLDRYAHVGLRDQAAALDKFTLPPDPSGPAAGPTAVPSGRQVLTAIGLTAV